MFPRVADSLPTANLLLLQRLLTVLCHISENVQTSKMDASNLAICVGPNMLSPGTDNVLTLAELKERNDKVCGVQPLAPAFGAARGQPRTAPCPCQSSTKQHL